MIVYRLRQQIKESGTEVVQFFATQAMGIDGFRKAVSSGMRAKLEKLNCPTDKYGIAIALNLAGMHADHWLAMETIRNDGF